MAKQKAAERPAVALAGEQAIAWRLHRQHLDRRAPREALIEVAARLCGLHAQVLSSAELTAWARVDGLEPGAVMQRALWEERSLVKTWAMRGTLHLLPAAEYGLWQAALSTVQRQTRESWLRYFGITAEEVETLLEAIAVALDGAHLTREELAAAVTRHTGSAALGEHVKGNWGSLLKPAAFQGRLIFAPGTGQTVRFTRPDRWLPDGAAPPSPSEALTETVRRYLHAYGPATVDDIARWWGGSTAQARRLLVALGEAVTPVEVDGTRAWLLTEDVPDAIGAGPPAGVRLLPVFDQYVVAAPRALPTLLPDPAFKPRVYREAGWISAVLLVDGRIAGVWRHERKGSRVLVTVEPFAPVSEAVRSAAADEAERLVAFLGGALVLTWAE